jgi:hypothetical protein
MRSLNSKHSQLREKSNNELSTFQRKMFCPKESALLDQATHEAHIAAGMKARGLQWLNANTRLSRGI